VQLLQFLCSGALIIALIMNYGLAFAEDINTANNRIVGCRAYLQAKAAPTFDFDAGVCSGIVEGVGDKTLDVCAPASATKEQAVQVVVQYIDSRPARLHDDFRALALEALRAAWPCKK